MTSMSGRLARRSAIRSMIASFSQRLIRTPAPRGAPCLELTPRAGGGVGILDRHVPARDRAVAGVEDLPVRAVIRIRLAVVAEPFLGEAAIGDGAAAVRTRDVRRDASRFARLNVSTLVVGNLLNGRPDTTRD